MKDLLRLRSLGVVKRAKIISPNRMLVVDHVSPGEDILSTHMWSPLHISNFSMIHTLRLYKF